MRGSPWPRKGIQSPHSLKQGVVTRSRSHIFLHRTRSGRPRVDPRQRHNYPVSTPRPRLPLKNPSVQEPPDEPFYGEIGNSIKDLRTRRVFTPGPVPDDFFPNQMAKHEADVKLVPDLMGKMDVPLEKGVTGADEGGKDDEIFQRSNSSEEECVQNTPPEYDPLCRSDTEAMEGSDGAVDDSHGKRISGNDGCRNNRLCHKEIDLSNPSQDRRELVPCSQLKLVRNPGSLSYRRLLPFLMDLTKTSSSTLKIIPCQKFVKSEKHILERSLPPFLASLPHVNMDVPKQHPSGGQETSHSEQLTENQAVLEYPYTEHPVPKHTNSNCYDPTSAIPLGPDGENPQTSAKGAIHEFEMIYMTPYFPPLPHETLSVEELVGPMRGPSVLPKQIDMNSGIVFSTSVTSVTPPRGTSESGGGRLTEEHALPPTKGILRMQPKECTGLCMCLDCASFRFNAEKAYQFSRKQMHEAEDVVIGLMKELSSLRKLVEKTVVPMTDADVSAFLQLNQKQVKGVFGRASAAEEVAKKRLREMNSDLNIHCRISRRRVTFAESVRTIVNSG